LAGPLLHTFEFAGCGSNLAKSTETKQVGWRMQVVARAYTLDYKPLARPLEALTVLNISRNFFIKDHFAINFFTAPMPRLQVLDFEESPLTGKGVLHIWSMAPGLTKFGISKWSKDPVAAAEEVKFFSNFLVAAARASRLLELDVSGAGLVALGDLKALFSIHSLERLQLAKMSADTTVASLLLPLGGMKSLRSLRLRSLVLGLAKEADAFDMAGAFHRLQTLQLWDLVGLEDTHMVPLSKWFSNIRTLSLRGRCAVTRDGLLVLLNSMNNLALLTIDADTGIYTPMSVFTDAYHSAPVEELVLPKYQLDKLFGNHSLNENENGNEKRNLDTKLRVLRIDATEKNGRWKFGSAMMDHIVRTMCLVCPFLETLDLSHHFAQLNAIVDFPPRTGLRHVIVCGRHDAAKFNGLPQQCAVRHVDCTPEANQAIPAAMKKNRFLYESTDSTFEYNLGDLFD
jgi:hypothetical protein